MKKILLTLILSLFFTTPLLAECKRHVVLYGIEDLMKELGVSEAYAASYRINLWDSPRRTGVVARLLPGTHLLILEETKDHYKVKAPEPQGGAVGWIGKVQAKKVVKQDTKTNKPCK